MSILSPILSCSDRTGNPQEPNAMRWLSRPDFSKPSVPMPVWKSSWTNYSFPTAFLSLLDLVPLLPILARAISLASSNSLLVESSSRAVWHDYKKVVSWCTPTITTIWRGFSIITSTISRKYLDLISKTPYWPDIHSRWLGVPSRIPENHR